MLIKPTSLRHLILADLSKHPPTRAVKILERITKQKNKTITIQGLQKELRLMISEGIAIKIEKKYSMNLAWCFDFVNYAAKVTGDCIENVTVGSLIPNGRKIKYKIHSLIQLQDLWTQIMFVMLQKSQSKTAYQWIPYPWFKFVDEGRSNRFFNSVTLGRFMIRTIVGDDSPPGLELANEGKKFGEFYSYNFSDSPFHDETTNYYTLIDDYLIKVTMDVDVHRLIEELFKSSRNSKTDYIGTIPKLASMPTMISLIVMNGGSQTDKVKGMFKKYFRI